METRTCTNVAYGLDPKLGGIAASLPGLCRALSAEGRYRSPIVAFCTPTDDPRTGEDLQVSRYPAGRLRWAMDSSLSRRLESEIRSAHLLHIHGLWAEHCLFAGRAARAARIPYIVSAHGMLEPRALRNKRWRKAIYAALVERGRLNRAACLRALTRSEAESFRRFGAGAPVVVVPNGVDVPQMLSPEPFFERYPELRDHPLVLFLGRIHWIKGLDLLCRAWAALAPRFPDARLVLAGPDSENTEHGVRMLARELGIEHRVTFTGLLEELKWSALAAARVFVLPSRSEGFSMAALEALGVGVPVVVTRQAHLPEVATRGCGWIVEPDAAQIASALSDALRASDAAQQPMRARGRALVQQLYTWPRVARQLSSVCDWLLGGELPVSAEVM